jgi:hypothetical protein
MSSFRILELAAAVAMIATGIFYYRRPRSDGDGDSYGGQGAVLLLVVGAIIGIHALGLLEYRPSASELNAMQGRP